jgi:hypothetical protein
MTCELCKKETVRLRHAMRDLARFMLWVGLEAEYQFGFDEYRADLVVWAIEQGRLRLEWPE